MLWLMTDSVWKSRGYVACCPWGPVRRRRSGLSCVRFLQQGRYLLLQTGNSHGAAKVSPHNSASFPHYPSHPYRVPHCSEEAAHHCNSHKWDSTELRQTWFPLASSPIGTAHHMSSIKTYLELHSLRWGLLSVQCLFLLSPIFSVPLTSSSNSALSLFFHALSSDSAHQASFSFHSLPLCNLLVLRHFVPRLIYSKISSCLTLGSPRHLSDPMTCTHGPW